ncbi:hypothetical protein NH340_JMT00429 [Sarcoptes scabiei]|nr:hypothetical protein NH340_JMT00429 [Sarcoptes scabiei]
MDVCLTVGLAEREKRFESESAFYSITKLATVATLKFDLLETLRGKFVNHHYYFDASDDDVDVELPFHNEIRSDQAENDSDWRETEIFGQMKSNLEALRMFQKQQNQYDSYQKEWIRMIKIYLATDEIDVWRTEVPSFKRKGYQFVGEIEHTKTAAPVQRFQIESYENFLLDVYALSRKDYRVCTLNSHLCRLAYELIQIDRDYDMSQNVISLDDVYYFGGQRPHRLVATVINDNKDKIVPKQLASDLIQDKR